MLIKFYNEKNIDLLYLSSNFEYKLCQDSLYIRDNGTKKTHQLKADRLVLENILNGLQNGISKEILFKLLSMTDCNPSKMMQDLLMEGLIE